MATNRSFNHDVPLSMSEFHSILFEQLANLEALRETYNDSSNVKITKEKIYEEYQNLFPSYVSLNGIRPYPTNGTHVFPNFLHFGDDSTVPKYPTIGDLYKDRSNDAISGVENPCHRISNEEASSYQNIAFQLELIVQPILIFIGFCFNTSAINILRR